MKLKVTAQLAILFSTLLLTNYASASKTEMGARCIGNVKSPVKAICEDSVKAITPISVRVDHVALDVDQNLYTVFLHFNESAFSDPDLPFSAGWIGRETQAAQSADYIFARSFIKGLVEIGLDPSAKAHHQFVLVCSKKDGLKTVTGKPASILLGCARYDPNKDAIDDDYKISN